MAQVAPYNIPEFLDYLGCGPAKNDAVCVACFRKDAPILLTSPAVRTDFYSLSLKVTGDVKPADTALSDSFLYFDGPEHPWEWNYTSAFTGYSIMVDSRLLGRMVKGYNFVHYSNHEALYLTTAEETILLDLFEKADAEFNKKDFSKEVIISYAGLILSYVQLYYKRQFESRSQQYNKVVADFYAHLEDYFSHPKELPELPTVTYFADRAFLSPNYFGDLIKHFTGNSPQEHIHQYIIQLAKQELRQTSLSVSEIAFRLGFDYPTYFTRFFRKETGITPTVFRNQ